MVALYDWGTRILQAFSVIADWLLTPIVENPTVASIINQILAFLDSFFGNMVPGKAVIQWVLDFVVNMPPADLILGGGLTFILGFKLVKFFTDFVL